MQKIISQQYAFTSETNRQFCFYHFVKCKPYTRIAGFSNVVSSEKKIIIKRWSHFTMKFFFHEKCNNDRLDFKKFPFYLQLFSYPLVWIWIKLEKSIFLLSNEFLFYEKPFLPLTPARQCGFSTKLNEFSLKKTVQVPTKNNDVFEHWKNVWINRLHEEKMVSN